MKAMSPAPGTKPRPRHRPDSSVVTLHVGFAVPEPLDRVSGGYLYDRAVAARLADGDVRLSFVGLLEGFPEATPAMLAETERRLLAWDGPLLIDGLALGAFSPELSARIGPRTVALVHHPLGLETGLAQARSEALIASERVALSTVRGVICTSVDTAARLRDGFGVSPERIEIARPGVARPSAPAPLLGDPPAILGVGAITRRKNFDGLVQALAQLADLPWTARIVGPRGVDAGAEAALTRAIDQGGLSGRITVAGPADDISSEFCAADIFVSSALYEGFGMAMAEAIAHGLPVVAVAGGGAHEAASGGVLVSPDPQSSLSHRLAKALRPLVETREARLSQAALALAAAERLSDWDDTAQIVRRALLRFLGDPDP